MPPKRRTSPTNAPNAKKPRAKAQDTEEAYVEGDAWLLPALHKHGGEDWDAVVRDPAFDALRRGRNVPTLKAALARLVGADLDVARGPGRARCSCAVRRASSTVASGCPSRHRTGLFHRHRYTQSIRISPPCKRSSERAAESQGPGVSAGGRCLGYTAHDGARHTRGGACQRARLAPRPADRSQGAPRADALL